MRGLLTGQVTPAEWRRQLVAEGITHAVLIKTDDWAGYAEALADGGIRPELQTGTVDVYQLRP